ncbi:hypothetical protein POTOM_029086 [Populus tomentosa]|uniref:RING-type domain-containing protein n=1 Tax=Populus tomentosa TaxID=118781 RepID=A0A8X7ZC55_POPTO|nr:hypothetical protein POTOM_029086 [Populus tomentosa]
MNSSSPVETHTQDFGEFALTFGVSIGVFSAMAIVVLASYFCSRKPIPAGRSLHDVSLSVNGQDSVIIEIGLNEATLNTYPKLLYSEAKEKLEKGDDLVAASCCSICLQDYKDSDLLRLLPECGHLFHAQCIDLWLKLHPTCPICRNSPVPTPINVTETASREPRRVLYDACTPSKDSSSTTDRGSIAIELGLDEATIASYPKLLYPQAKLQPKANHSLPSCSSICLGDDEDSDMSRLSPDCGLTFISNVQAISVELTLSPTELLFSLKSMDPSGWRAAPQKFLPGEVVNPGSCEEEEKGEHCLHYLSGYKTVASSSEDNWITPPAFPTDQGGAPAPGPPSRPTDRGVVSLQSLLDALYCDCGAWQLQSQTGGHAITKISGPCFEVDIRPGTPSTVRLTLGGVVDVQNLAGMMSRPINTERIILVTVSKHLLVDGRKRIKEEEEQAVREALGLAPKRSSRPQGNRLDKHEYSELVKRGSTVEDLGAGHAEVARVDGLGFSRAPRAWEDPSTLPSIAKEAPPEPVKVAARDPSTGNSEEDRPEEDGSSRKKRRHEEKEKKHEKHDRREKHHPHDPDNKRKRQKDKERRRHDSDSN